MTEQHENEAGADPGLAIDGAITYMHIPATDLGQAASFYGNAFGWTIHNPDSDRPGFDTPNGQLSGAWVRDQKPIGEAGLLPFIYVDDVDATVERIIANGGAIVTEPYPEGLLTVATFHDPAGNLLGLWHDTTRE